MDVLTLIRPEIKVPPVPISSLLHSCIWNSLHSRTVVICASITIQCGSHDPAPEQGIQDPSQDLSCNPSPGISLWDAEPLLAHKDGTVVLQNLFCYDQVKGARKKVERLGCVWEGEEKEKMSEGVRD